MGRSVICSGLEEYNADFWLTKNCSAGPVKLTVERVWWGCEVLWGCAAFKSEKGPNKALGTNGVSSKLSLRRVQRPFPGPPVVPFYRFFFGWEGSPTKIDKAEKESGTNLF